MILRRMIEHVKAQNWTAVALDFVIVVMGVFIGIQVSNWNAARADRAAEAQYLDRLHEELELTAERLDVDLGWQIENAQRLRFVIESLRRCDLAEKDRDEFALGLFVAGKLNLPMLVDTTLEELKSSGRMNIIQDKQLRSGLIDLQRRFQVSASHIDAVGTWAVEPVNQINKRVIYLNLDENSSTRNNVGWSDIEFDFDAACEDPAFIAGLSAVWNYTLENVRRDRSLSEETNELVSRIEEIQ